MAQKQFNSQQEQSGMKTHRNTHAILFLSFRTSFSFERDSLELPLSVPVLLSPLLFLDQVFLLPACLCLRLRRRQLLLPRLHLLLYPRLLSPKHPRVRYISHQFDIIQFFELFADFFRVFFVGYNLDGDAQETKIEALKKKKAEAEAKKKAAFEEKQKKGEEQQKARLESIAKKKEEAAARAAAAAVKESPEEKAAKIAAEKAAKAEVAEAKKAEIAAANAARKEEAAAKKEAAAKAAEEAKAAAAAKREEAAQAAAAKKEAAAAGKLLKSVRKEEAPNVQVKTIMNQERNNSLQNWLEILNL